MNRNVFIRVTSLTMDELPIEKIEGRLTGGSINIDGNSAVRRTISLTLVTDRLNISDYYWSLNTKFKAEIGIQDENTNGQIIWYPQGVYIISSFSSSLSTNSFTVNISGKDKMCLLNGENGGVFPSQVDLGQEEEYDNKGNRVLKKRKIENIIRDIISYYGCESLKNIVIQDLDNVALELQTYRFDEPLYLLRKADQGSPKIYMQATFDKEINDSRMLSQLDAYDKDTILGKIEGENFHFSESGDTYVAKQITYGQVAGYIPTDLIYAGDLIIKAGESITSALDKIKNMLGDYEYFYDLDGTFIWRKKETYLNVPFSPIEKNENGEWYVDPYKKECKYRFANNDMVTAISLTPNLSNVKNDFTIWGTRKSTTGKEFAAHLRYAVDIKPLIYNSIQVTQNDIEYYNGLIKSPQESKAYVSELVFNSTSYNKEAQKLTIKIPEGYIQEDQDKLTVINNIMTVEGDTAILSFGANNNNYYDWRELIFQMAKDYYLYGRMDDFELRVAKANPHMPFGRTGYEQYYTDMQGFWRSIYSPENVYVRVYDINANNYTEYYIMNENGEYIHPYTAYNENISYYDISNEYYPANHQYAYWHKNVIEEPEMLSFWLDFLDTDGDISKYSVKSIGVRPKVVNDKDVKAIYYREVPSISWSGSAGDAVEVVLQIGEAYQKMFIPSSRGKSAFEALNTLLYNHLCISENVSITSVPIYDLEPNTKIYVENRENGISGEYLINKITIPLTYNGTMNISAVKAVDRIL